MVYITDFYNCSLIVRLVSKIKNNICALLPGSPFSCSLMWVGKKVEPGYPVSALFLKIKVHSFEVHSQVGPIRLQHTVLGLLVSAQLSKQMG